MSIHYVSSHELKKYFKQTQTTFKKKKKKKEAHINTHIHTLYTHI
jgi:hypothetical protein